MTGFSLAQGIMHAVHCSPIFVGALGFDLSSLVMARYTPVRALWSRRFTDAPHTKQVLGNPLVRTLAWLSSYPPEEVDQVRAPMVMLCWLWCFGARVQVLWNTRILTQHVVCTAVLIVCMYESCSSSIIVVVVVVVVVVVGSRVSRRGHIASAAQLHHWHDERKIAAAAAAVEAAAAPTASAQTTWSCFVSLSYSPACLAAPGAGLVLLHRHHQLYPRPLQPNQGPLWRVLVDHETPGITRGFLAPRRLS